MMAIYYPDLEKTNLICCWQVLQSSEEIPAVFAFFDEEVASSQGNRLVLMVFFWPGIPIHLAWVFVQSHIGFPLESSLSAVIIFSAKREGTKPKAVELPPILVALARRGADMTEILLETTRQCVVVDFVASSLDREPWSHGRCILR